MWRRDALIALLIGLAGFLIGGSYASLPKVVAAGSYYQETMAPSVMLACGRGLSNIDPSAAPELAAFLARTRDSLDCAAIPAAPIVKLTALQAASRYLLVAVGLAWKVSGISWSGLWWLLAALYGSVASLAYLAARTLGGRVMAGMVATLLLTSSLQLGALPHLRDYSKAPFFNAMLLITLVVVTRAHSARALVAWSAAAGALMGIAFGVRFDMMLFLAIYLGAVLLATPGSIVEQWRSRTAAIAVCVVVFLIVAMPVLRSFELGNNSWHVIILGFAEPHQSALELRTPAYQLGSLYNDSFVSAVVNSTTLRVHGGSMLQPLDSPGYGAAAAEYFKLVARQFPADLLVRAWAGVVQLGRLSFDSWRVIPALMPLDNAAGSIIAARAYVLAWALWALPWLPALALVTLLGAAANHLRLSLLGIGACVFLGGMSSLQFQGRHVFHLESLSLLLAAVAIECGIKAAWRFRRQGLSSVIAQPRRMVPVALLAVALAASVTVPLIALRRHQQSSVTELFNGYNRAAVLHEPTTRATSADGVTLIAFDQDRPRGDAALSSDLVAADFGGPQCDYDEVSGVIRYASAHDGADFSRPFVVHVPPAPGLTRMWFGTYTLHEARPNGGYAFAGLEVPSARAACAATLMRVDNVNQFPLLVDASLEPGWESSPMYLKFRRFEAFEPRPITYLWPENQSVTRTALTGTMSAPGGATDFVARTATVTGHTRVRVEGIASAAAYLVSWVPTTIDDRQLFLAEGELESGGVVFGLEHDGAWAAQIPITVAGRFRVAIKPPAAGEYRVVIANNRAGGALWTSLSVDRLGWTRTGVE